MHKTRDRLFKLVMTALLGALVVILQLFFQIKIGPFNMTLALVPIVFGSVTLGAGYGTALGLVFGVIASVMSISGLDLGGYAVFEANAAIAWILCLTKGAMAGLLPALVHKAFKNKKAAPWILVGSSGVFLFLAGFAVCKLLPSWELPKWGKIIAVVVAALIAAAYLLVIHLAITKESSPVYLASMVAPVANTGIFIAGMFIFFRSVLDTWASAQGSSVFIFVISMIVFANFTLEFAVSVLFAPAVAAAAKAMNKRRR
ncbi:MAG: hypothetical protein IKO92_04395 [Clostridia bacterium]|nr:hypothetical protein [Clostridia bacterium]